MSLALLKACVCIPSHIEEKCPVSGLHVGFAKKEQSAELKSLLPEVGLQEMMAG